MSNSIPPNNLDQLVAWLRTFSSQLNLQMSQLKGDIEGLKNFRKLHNNKKDENEHTS